MNCKVISTAIQFALIGDHSSNKYGGNTEQLIQGGVHREPLSVSERLLGPIIWVLSNINAVHLYIHAYTDIQILFRFVLISSVVSHLV